MSERESRRDRPALPDDVVDWFNSRLGGFNELVGLRFVSVDYDEVVAEIPVTEKLWQPYGLVHGGVYAAMIETLASAAAAINATPDGLHVVGLENATSFLRAVREGTLRGAARPLVRGRRSHVWEVEVRGDDGKLAAKGRVRMLCLPHGSEVAGSVVAVRSGDD